MSASHQPNQMPTIVVIGAGVVGLSCAIKLQSMIERSNRKSIAGAQVMLISREWPTSTIPTTPPRHTPDYASMWAGAHVRPIPATTPQLRREAKWLRETVAQLGEQLAAEPWSGITRVTAIELLEAPHDGPYRGQDAATFAAESGLSCYRRWSAEELPDEDVGLGFEYETFCIDPSLYCQSLLRRFVLRGGKTLHRDLGSEWEAFRVLEDVALVVDASGTGFADAKYFPTRGQTVLTNMTDATKTVTRQHRDGTWSFIIPRFFSGGTVVGGTKKPDDWSVEPEAGVRSALLAAGRRLRPLARTSPSSASDDDGDDGGRGRGIAPEEIGFVADIVGRRPTREGGMRVELETRWLPGGEAAVLHAYGAGGRGYEISWGVANEVAELAGEYLLTPR